MPPSTPQHRPLFGALYIAVAMLLFACQDVVIKQASTDLPVLQLLAVRTAMVTLMLVLAVSVIHPAAWRAANPWPLVLRGTLAFLAFSSYYLALAFIPLAEASAVYMSAPLFVTLLSIPLLGERVGRHRALAVLLGFVGVMIVINPGASLFRVESAVPLFSALCYALIPIITRKAGLREHALTMALYTTVPYLFWTLLVGAWVTFFTEQGELSAATGVTANLTSAWQPLTREQLVALGIAALFFTGGLLSITEAYRIAAVSSLAPFEYSHLLWSTALGLIAFGDLPAVNTLVGGVLIVACGCYVAFREHQNRTL